MAVSEEAQESPKPEAETGFGTGLRGKLKKRQEPDVPEANGAPPPDVEQAPERGGIRSRPRRRRQREPAPGHVGGRRASGRAVGGSGTRARPAHRAGHLVLHARRGERPRRRPCRTVGGARPPCREDRLRRAGDRPARGAAHGAAAELPRGARASLRAGDQADGVRGPDRRALPAGRVEAPRAPRRRPSAREARLGAGQAGADPGLAGDEARSPRADRRELARPR